MTVLGKSGYFGKIAELTAEFTRTDSGIIE